MRSVEYSGGAWRWEGWESGSTPRTPDSDTGPEEWNEMLLKFEIIPTVYLSIDWKFNNGTQPVWVTNDS